MRIKNGLSVILSRRMEQFDWQPGGKDLLLTIQLYIKENGGNLSLASKIIDEDRDERRQAYINSYAKTYGYRGRRDRKKVMAFKGDETILFENTTEAAKFIDVATSNIRASVQQNSRCKKWKFEYII